MAWATLERTKSISHIMMFVAKRLHIYNIYHILYILYQYTHYILD